MVIMKGQSAITITALIGLMVVVIIAISVVIPVVQNQVNSYATPIGLTGTYNFAAYNTYYTITNYPLNSITAIYNNVSKTCIVQTRNYTVNTNAGSIALFP